MRGGYGLRAALLVGLCYLAPTSEARDRPFYRQALNAFESLPLRERKMIYFELMATGDFNAMASSEFGPRLYDATAQFQEKNGVEPSGVLTPETRMALSEIGSRIFNSWGMALVDHPFADAALAVPGRFGLEATGTGHGVALENRRHTMSVAFAFFRDGEATLETVFDNLTRSAPGRQIAMQVLKPGFLAVAGSFGDKQTYSRYIPTQGGVVGFTLSWSPVSFPNGARIAVVMANELYPRRMAGGDMFALLPSEAPPAGAIPDNGSASALGRNEAEDAARQQAQQQAESRKRIEAAARKAAEDQARIAREAEEARKAKEETERRIAQEQINAARLAAAKSAAKDALDDAVQFVQSNHDDPRLLDHLQAITDLKAAAEGSDADALDRRRSQLQAQLKANPVYAGWEERRVAERRRAEENDLRDALAALSVQRRFLIEQVAADPTGAAAGRLLELARQADSVSAAPALASAQSLVGRIDAAIQEANLGQRYALARSDARKRADDGASSLNTTAAPSQPQ